MKNLSLDNQRLEIMSAILDLCEQAKSYKVVIDESQNICVKDLKWQCFFINEDYVELTCSKGKHDLLKVSKLNNLKAFELVIAAVLVDNGIK